MKETKTVIIYRSQTGFTRRYAQALSQALGCHCVPYEKRNGVDLAAADCIIYGGWCRAGSIVGIKWIQRQMQRYAHKTFVVFAVGALPEPDAQAWAAVKESLPQGVSLFYLPGGLCVKRLTPGYRLLLRLFLRMLKKAENMTPQEKRILEAMERPQDLFEPRHIAPVVEAVQGIKA